MKKLWKAACLLFTCVLSVSCLSGCGGGKELPANTVLMWSIAGNEETRMLAGIKEAFNAQSSDVQMQFVPMQNYDGILEMFKYGTGLPDIVYIDDEYFKRFASGGHIAPLDELLTGGGLI